MNRWREGRDGSRIRVIETTAGPVETAFFPMEAVDAICVSSQAGCNIGCAFCVTGLQRSTGNLSPDEIVAQVADVEEFRRPGKRLEVGFQGMGEPLLNLGGVLPAADQLLAKYAGVGIRLSTVGLVPLLRRFSGAGRQVKLQISLHAPTQELRERLIPATRGTRLRELMDLASAHGQACGSDSLLNYVLLDGVNDSPAHAEQLATLVVGRPSVRVKLASFNAHSAIPFRATPEEKARIFADRLAEAGVEPRWFSSRGDDIGAACGQFTVKAGRGVSR